MAVSNLTNANPLTSALLTGAPIGQHEQPPIMNSARIVNNTDDGAVLCYDDTEVAARAQNGDHITFYPNSFAYSYSNGNATIATLPGGIVAASENGSLVTVDQAHNVSVQLGNQKSITLGNFGDPKFDAYRSLVHSGLISDSTLENLEILDSHNHDISALIPVHEDFGPSTEKALLEAQQRASKKLTGS